MDNELSVAERRMVESFVQNHPDLKDELDILLQSKLTPDSNIVFESKEELMKSANDSSITLSNYEEWLTLYIDNEIIPEQRTEVERFVAAHPQVQNELAILQKAKLQAEEIIFPYKESLYRQTEKVRVIQMRWWRVAAAAILLLGLSTAIILVLNKKKQPGESFASSTLNDQLKTTTRNIAKTTLQNNNLPTEPETKKDNKEVKQSNSVLPNLAKNNNFIEKKLPENKNDKKDEPIIANNDNNKSNDLPQPENNPNIKRNATNYGVAIPIESNPPPTNLGGIVTNPIPIPSDKGLTFASNQENNSSDLQSGQNKSSRGFFRKAIRFIEKRTGIKPANDDDRVLIGSLAVKL